MMPKPQRIFLLYMVTQNLKPNYIEQEEYLAMDYNLHIYAHQLVYPLKGHSHIICERCIGKGAFRAPPSKGLHYLWMPPKPKKPTPQWSWCGEGTHISTIRSAACDNLNRKAYREYEDCRITDKADGRKGPPRPPDVTQTSDKSLESSYLSIKIFKSSLWWATNVVSTALDTQK